MKLIAITPEITLSHESEYIEMILDSGFDYVHIRKPSFDVNAMRKFILNIPQLFHSRLKLHSCFELVDEFNVAGVHLNSRNKYFEQNDSCNELLLSKSCHSVGELSTSCEYEYVFLSPVFDSISKNGYKSNFELEEISQIFRTRSYSNVIALGGIKAEYMPLLAETGFAGAAFLGYLFCDVDKNELNKKLEFINKYKR